MRSAHSFSIPFYTLGLWAACAVIPSHEALAIPFSAESTKRESVRIESVGPAPEFKRSYKALTKDSRDLSFQSLTDGRLFLAFATADDTIDDLTFDGRSYDRCSAGADQVYWTDKTADLPPVCISISDNGVQGNANSYKPLIGGPAGDEGRYVVFETLNTDSALFRGKMPAGSPQVVVHDRKFERSWLSTSKCNTDGSDGALSLWQFSEDGQTIALTSSGTNLIDNLKPECSDPNGTTADVFLRNGKDCNPNSLGECRTEVLYDDYDLHAGTSVVDLLDYDSQNVWMNPDRSVIVFDTLSTLPVHFNPDVRGKKDIYYYKDSHFHLLSQTQLALYSDITGKVVIKNVGGAANGDSERPRTDTSGRYVVFESQASDLVLKAGSSSEYLPTSGRKQIYLHDYISGISEMISIGRNGIGANGDSQNAWLSGDARYIVYESRATNILGDKDTTPVKNIFLYDRALKRHFLVSTGNTADERGLSADATISQVSKEGLQVAFHTSANNVVLDSDPANGGTSQPGVQHVYLANHNCPLDTDGDKIPDCLDLCPTDLKKSEPGFCGCGKLETDRDADETPDCVDQCPDDPKKTAIGACGCGVEDIDSDRDGVADCVDACPLDSTKTNPGACGCGSQDIDSDQDGAADCVDQCPANPARSIKGSCACTDLKDEPGQCGCNVADIDANKNGAADCVDPTAATLPEVPRVKISRGGTGASARYKLRVIMQAFPGSVKYGTTLRGPHGTVKRSSSRQEIVFRSQTAGTYKFSYRVGVGSVKSQTRTVTIKLPGGIKAAKKAKKK